MKGPIKKPDQIELWIQYLQQFTYIATRYSIEAIYNSIKPGHEFSTLLEDYVFEGGLNFELFRDELKEKMAQSISPNIILTHVGKEIEPTIQLYKNWYQNNESEIDKFNQYNPYKILLVLVKDTENEIAKYLPAKLVRNQDDRFSSQKEEALYMFYANKKVKPENSKLYQYYLVYCDKVNRCGSTESKVKDRNRVELLEKVIEKLEGKQKEIAEIELKELKKYTDR